MKKCPFKTEGKITLDGTKDIFIDKGGVIRAVDDVRAKVNAMRECDGANCQMWIQQSFRGSRDKGHCGLLRRASC